MARCQVCYRRFPGATPCPRDGWAPPPLRAESAELPEIPSIPGLVIEALLGAGGSATVWRARAPGIEEPLALKVGRGDSPVAVQRFLRDAEAIRRLGPPFAPKLAAEGATADGRPFMLMELVAGETLAARLEELSSPPEPAWAAGVADAILAAIEAAHERGIIHRDLKPENIIWNEVTRRAALIDFGLMRSPSDAYEAGATHLGTVVGTPEYMAPEQIRGDFAQDTKVDLYAFGVILFELLTLSLPFSGDRGLIEHGHLAWRPPRPSDLAPVPIALEKLTLACLAKDPLRRPEDARSLRLALRSAIPPAPTTLGRQDESAPPPSLLNSMVKRAQLLVDRGQPAIVMVLTLDGSGAPEAARAVAAHKGFVARQKTMEGTAGQAGLPPHTSRANRLVCVFSGIFAPDPIEEAIAAAHEVTDALGGHAALHLAPLMLRRKEIGLPSVYGAAVDQPAGWMPSSAFQGIALTAEIARALPFSEAGRIEPDPSLKGPDGAAFFRLSAPPPRGTLSACGAPLIGREGIMAAIAESMRASLEGGCPGLFTLIGDQGLGKSRMAEEAASLVRAVDANALVVSLRATAPVAGDMAHTARELFERLFEGSGRPAPHEDGLHADRGAATRRLADGLRDRARERFTAIILDDAHWADEVTLGALELATMDIEAGPLWVLIAAHPRFEEARRCFGARAERHDRATLGPLEEASMMKLAEALLLPAEYTPAATLRQLASFAGHNPYCMTELISALKRSGIVRRRPSGSFYVATAELDRLPPLPAWQWLAGRRLDALPPDLAACARLCSALGADFSRDEVEQIEDAIDEDGGAGTPLDAEVGLTALASAGILMRLPGGWFAFQSAPFRDAVYDALAPSSKRMIHKHAFAWWAAEAKRAPSGDRRSLAHLAFHAAACGERRAAIRAYIDLGDAAREAYEHVEADQRYTAALSCMEGEPLDKTGAPSDGLQRGETPADVRALMERDRASVLLGRAKVRCRVHRISEALDDLRAAIAIARRLGDKRLLVDALLEEATVLDWANDFDASATRAEEARPIALTIGDPALENRCRMAEGRSLWRQQRVREAIFLLAKAADGAKSVGDHDTRVMALLLLASALVLAGRPEEAEARFDEVIALATESSDGLHLCSAYANRAFLWTAQGAPERGMEDLRRAVRIAREVGNPEPEHVATHNLAELLYWSGQDHPALALARRSRALGARFGEREDPSDTLLVARILAMRGDYGEASRLVAEIAEQSPPSSSSPTPRALFRMLELALAEEGAGPSPGGEGWSDLARRADEDLPLEEQLEVLYWRARSAIRGERWAEAEEACARGEARLGGCALFRPRFIELRARIAGRV